MSSQPANIGPAPRAQATLFRFRLRSMLVYVGLLCILFAAMSAAGGMLALAILLVAVIVAAHVLSTFVGTRLRDGAMAEYPQYSPVAADGGRPHEPLLAATAPPHRVIAAEKERSRQLGGRGSLVPRLMWFVVGGSLVGAVVYAAIVVELLWPNVSLAAMIAGGVAAGILSGWVVFLGFSFYVISRRAWREAVQPASLTIPHQTAPAGTVPNQT